MISEFLNNINSLVDNEEKSSCEVIDQYLWDLCCFSIDDQGSVELGIRHLAGHLNQMLPLLAERGPNPTFH